MQTNYPITNMTATENLYALINFDTIQLLIPQYEIETLEPVSEIDAIQENTRSIGLIKTLDKQWPIYCFDQTLELTSNMPNSHRICVLMSKQATNIGITCEQIKTLDQKFPCFQAIPSCMSNPDSPIDALVVLNQNNIAYSSSVLHLANYIKTKISCPNYQI